MNVVFVTESLFYLQQFKLFIKVAQVQGKRHQKSKMKDLKLLKKRFFCEIDDFSFLTSL